MSETIRKYRPSTYCTFRFWSDCVNRLIRLQSSPHGSSKNPIHQKLNSLSSNTVISFRVLAHLPKKKTDKLVWWVRQYYLVLIPTGRVKVFSLSLQQTLTSIREHSKKEKIVQKQNWLLETYVMYSNNILMIYLSGIDFVLFFSNLISIIFSFFLYSFICDRHLIIH